MVKREADTYITSETVEDDSKTVEEEGGEFKKAPDDEIKKRVIRPLKRKGGSNQPTMIEPEIPNPSNIFSGFSFGKQPTTDLASNTKSFSFASPAADPIAFGSSNATNASFGLPNLKSSDISAKSAFSFGSDAVARQEKPSTSSNLDESQLKELEVIAKQLRGLNESFIAKARSLMDDSPLQDLSMLFDKYQNHRSSLISSSRVEQILVAVSTGTTKKHEASVKPVMNDFKMSSPTAPTIKPVKAELSMPKPPAPPSNASGIQPFSFGGFSSTPSTTPAGSTGGFNPFPSIPAATEAKKTTEVSSDSSKTKSLFALSPKPSEKSAVDPVSEKKPEASIPTVSVDAAKQPSLVTTAGFNFKFGGVSSNATPSFGIPTPTTASLLPTASSPSANTALTFGSTNTNSAPFSFGSSTATSSFGGISSPSQPTSSVSTEAPTTFSFGNPAASSGDVAKPFLFGNTGSSALGISNQPAFGVPEKKDTSGANEGAGDGNDEEDEEGKDEQITLMVGAGEELETNEFEVRAKLYAMDPESAKWASQGIGQLRLKKLKSEAKYRLLLRAEGSGRILLNAAVFKDMPVNSPSSNDVLVVAQTEDKKMDKYLIRVKTKEMASDLSKAIEDAKNAIPK